MKLLMPFCLPAPPPAICLTRVTVASTVKALWICSNNMAVYGSQPLECFLCLLEGSPERLLICTPFGMLFTTVWEVPGSRLRSALLGACVLADSQDAWTGPHVQMGTLRVGSG